MLISAYRFAGKPQRILDLALSAAFVSLTSDPLKEELARVLEVKFLMSPQLVAEACTPFWQLAEWIDPKIETHLCPDEADNRVIECALDGKADFIVTGDRHLLDLKAVSGVAILKPDAFLAELQSQAFRNDPAECS